jgi:two-component system, cell cycle sensor histidine kinase and response regulator CckA
VLAIRSGPLREDAAIKPSPLVHFLRQKYTRICIIYLLAASGYIVVSGLIVAATVHYDPKVLMAETLKGLGFVAVTTVLLWLLLHRAYSSRKFGEATFRNLVDSQPDAVLVLRVPEREIVYANPAAEHMFGYPTTELLGERTENLHVSRQQFEAFHEQSSPVLAADRPFRTEWEMRRRDGSVFPVEIIVRVFEVGPDDAFAISIVRDISERRERDEVLRRSEARFRELAENLRQVFWISDPEKSIMEYVNPAYERVWGRPVESLYDAPLSFLDAVHPDDRARVAGEVPRQAEGGFDTEYRIVRPDGEVAWIWDRAVPVRDEEGRVYRVIGVAEDITELKRAEAQLHQAQKIDAIGNLAGGIAHDFNNLLTVVFGNLDALRSDRDLPEAGRNRLVDNALQAAEKAAGLTRQLLAFSRTQVLMPRRTEVNQLIIDLVQLISRTLREDIELKVTLDPGLPQIHVDSAQLETAILNLVLNARDAMPGGGTIEIRTSACDIDRRAGAAALPCAPGRYVAVEVTDDGLGMSAQVRERIFEPFYTTKEVGKGTGLGLSTTLGFVRQSDGGIEIDSEPGRGTRIRILLPIDGVAADDSGTGDVSSPRETPTPAPRRVLLVEDDAPVRATISAQLVAQGCEVMEAANVCDALAVLECEASAVDVIISDYAMPGGQNGLDLAREVARRWPAIGFVLCSGHAEDSRSLSELGLPGIRFLPKPFRPRDLADTLRKVLS